MITILKATTKHTTEVREIAKQYGIKGCKLGTNFVHVGKQGNRIGSQVAHQFMDAVKRAGYYIDGEDTVRELADKELFDTALVAKLS